VLDLSDSIVLSWGLCATRRRRRLSALKPKTRWRCLLFPPKLNCANHSAKTKTRIAEEISSFQAGGATNINDGIFVAAEYLLKSAPKGRRVIILISDDVSTDAGGQGTRDIVTETIARTPLCIT